MICKEIFRDKRVAQVIGQSPKIDKFTWATTFFHYLGLKHYRKTKIDFLLPCLSHVVAIPMISHVDEI